jgi:hypothetical protein
MITRLRYYWVVVALATGACGGRGAPKTTVTPVRMVAADSVVTCTDWVRRATADPEMGVEQVPAPVAFKPAPIPRPIPKGVLGKDGKAEVRIRVLVDTMGVADMTTFTVIKSTSTTLTKLVRTAVAKWTFTPAQVSGCKVPRNFNWAAVYPPARAGDDNDDAR